MAISNSTDRFNGALASLAIKVPCVVVTNAAITLSGVQTVNGVAVVAGDRVLVKDQVDTIENGIYEVSSSAWVRTPDFDGTRDVTTRTIVIASNDVGVSVMYECTSVLPITIGTSNITFAVFQYLFGAVAKILADINAATPPTTENVSAALRMFDADETDELGHVGFSGTNVLRLKNEMGSGHIEIVGTTIGDTDFRVLRADPDLSEAVLPTTEKHKGGDTSVSSATSGVTLTDDPHLVGWDLEGATRYTIEGYIAYTQNVGDLKFALQFENAPDKDSIMFTVVDTAGAVAQDSGLVDATYSITTMGDGLEAGLHITGFFESNGAGGTLDFQWAQDTSDANNTTLREGSWIRIYRKN